MTDDYCINIEGADLNDLLNDLPFPKRQILDSSKLQEFADDSFTINENGRNFSKREENIVGKG